MADDARRVSLLLGTLFGITGLGSAATAVALPLMREDLGVDVGNATWTLSLYALMLAVATPVYGRVSDLVGVRLPLLVGVALMSVGALMAAAAPSYAVLLVARIVQGAGAAAIPTLGVVVVSHRYDGALRGLALGRLAGVTAALSSIGPLAGGLVEQVAGWRGVLALPVVGVLVVPLVWGALTGQGTGASLDVLGATLVGGTAAGLVLLVQSPATGRLVGLGGLLLLVLGTPAVARHVRRRPHGFLPRSVITDPTVVRSAVAAAAVPSAWFGLLIAVPAVLVDDGWAAWQVGLLLVPPAVLSLVVPSYAGRLLDRIGPIRALVLSGLLATAALGLAVPAAAGSVPGLMLVAAALVTTAYGVGQPALSASVSAAVDADVRGAALGVSTLIFMVGASVGSAAVGGLGEVVGIPGALAVLAFLPVLGVLVLLPELRRSRVPDPNGVST
ncbi:MFS transporter [Nocardioides sp. J54]|uniref:MFS transporter n=1 Tax=Nocardioides sp. J54 TaxID=935866 RepID=UPI0004AE6447|nr:MFS transporter [Nocardioides sp. J54]